MAQSAKEDIQQKAISGTEFKRVLQAIKDKQTQASEIQGQVGKMTSQAVEDYGLEKNALTFVRRLSKMDESKRHSVIKGVIDLSTKAGFFDGMDGFDDIVMAMNEVVMTANKVGHNSGNA